MIRKTSIETYEKIKASGVLSTRRLQVYEALYFLGPSTGGEIYKEMKRRFGAMMPTNSNTTTRLGELRRMGVAEEVGERKCSVTGQNVILWDLTGKMPIKYEKAKRIKCNHCEGKGYYETTQSKLF